MNGTFGSPSFGGNVNNRTTNNAIMRARGYITADARNQTEYGTVRSYIAVGVTGSDANGTPNNGPATGAVFDANRVFIQWAGFTFGTAQSFFDFYSPPAVSYYPHPNSDTGDAGWKTFAYTAQFGNGFSATLASEMRRSTQIVLNSAVGIAGISAAPVLASAQAGSLVGGGAGAGANTYAGYGGFQMPDIVANLRVDQAWGSAQIMAALHQVNAGYYTAALENSGNPSDEWGWVAGFGFKFNTPFIGQGDFFQMQANYTEGALRYLFQNSGTNWYVQHGASAALGIMSDGVYGGTVAGATTTNVQLTTGWEVNASYEHFWNPRWRTSVYGGYAAVSYNSSANAMLCSQEGFGAVGSGIGAAAVAQVGCDNDWNTWWIGSRTQWNVTKDFYIGVDVMYQKLQGMTTPTGLIPVGTAPVTTACNGTLAGTGTQRCSAGNEDNVGVRFRVHRDFYP